MWDDFPFPILRDFCLTVGTVSRSWTWKVSACTRASRFSPCGYWDMRWTGRQGWWAYTSGRLAAGSPTNHPWQERNMIRNIHLQGIMCKMLIFRGVFLTRSGGWNHSTCPFFFQEHRHRHLRERWKEFFGQVKLQARNAEDSDQTGRCRAIWVGFIHLFRENPWQYGDNDYTSRILKVMTSFKKKLSKKDMLFAMKRCLFVFFTIFCWPFLDFWDDLCCFFGAKPKNKSWYLDLNIVADFHVSVYQEKGGLFWGLKWLINVGEDDELMTGLDHSVRSLQLIPQPAAHHAKKGILMRYVPCYDSYPMGSTGLLYLPTFGWSWWKYIYI